MICCGIDRFLPLSADRDARPQFLRFFREGNSAITRPFFIVSVAKLDGDAVALGVAAVIKRQGILFIGMNKQSVQCESDDGIIIGIFGKVGDVASPPVRFVRLCQGQTTTDRR